MGAAPICPAAAAVELPIGAEVVEDDEAAFQEIRAQTGRLLVVHGPEPRLREIGNRILAQLRVVEREHAAFVDMRIQVADFLQDSRQIELGTSGGGIQVGVDPAASLTVSASTSGGGVRIDGLPFAPQSQSQSSARGTINSGAGRLRAETSGGGIALQAAAPPN